MPHSNIFYYHYFDRVLTLKSKKTLYIENQCIEDGTHNATETAVCNSSEITEEDTLNATETAVSNSSEIYCCSKC